MLVATSPIALPGLAGIWVILFSIIAFLIAAFLFNQGGQSKKAGSL